jgi:hypothetical protein
MDIILTMNTGIDKNGLLIMNRKAILIDYLKGWLFIDVFSTLPYNLILDATGLNSNLDAS